MDRRAVAGDVRGERDERKRDKPRVQETKRDRKCRAWNKTMDQRSLYKVETGGKILIKGWQRKWKRERNTDKERWRVEERGNAKDGGRREKEKAEGFFEEREKVISMEGVRARGKGAGSVNGERGKTEKEREGNEGRARETDAYIGPDGSERDGVSKLEECFSWQRRGSGTVSVQSSQVSPREGDILRRRTFTGPYVVAFTAHVTPSFRSFRVRVRVSFFFTLSFRFSSSSFGYLPPVSFAGRAHSRLFASSSRVSRCLPLDLFHPAPPVKPTFRERGRTGEARSRARVRNSSRHKLRL